MVAGLAQGVVFTGVVLEMLPSIASTQGVLTMSMLFMMRNLATIILVSRLFR
ncbi:MAG: hypothetical protein QM571_02710 [Micrococcaceae bacterium]